MCRSNGTKENLERNVFGNIDLVRALLPYWIVGVEVSFCLSQRALSDTEVWRALLPRRFHVAMRDVKKLERGVFGNDVWRALLPSTNRLGNAGREKLGKGCVWERCLGKRCCIVG